MCKCIHFAHPKHGHNCKFSIRSVKYSLSRKYLEVKLQKYNHEQVLHVIIQVIHCKSVRQIHFWLLIFWGIETGWSIHLYFELIMNSISKLLTLIFSQGNDATAIWSVKSQISFNRASLKTKEENERKVHKHWTFFQLSNENRIQLKCHSLCFDDGPLVCEWSPLSSLDQPKDETHKPPSTWTNRFLGNTWDNGVIFTVYELSLSHPVWFLWSDL